MLTTKREGKTKGERKRKKSKKNSETVNGRTHRYIKMSLYRNFIRRESGIKFTKSKIQRNKNKYIRKNKYAKKKKEKKKRIEKVKLKTIRSMAEST